MFAENSALAVLIQVCWPACIAIYLTFAFSRGGPRRLWRDAAALTIVIALIALWGQRITYWRHAPLDAARWSDASGVDMWRFFPLAVSAPQLKRDSLGSVGSPRDREWCPQDRPADRRPEEGRCTHRGNGRPQRRLTDCA